MSASWQHTRCWPLAIARTLIEEWNNFHHKIMVNVIEQLRIRLQACVQAKGWYFEHNLWLRHCREKALWINMRDNWTLSMAKYCNNQKRIVRILNNVYVVTSMGHSALLFNLTRVSSVSETTPEARLYFNKPHLYISRWLDRTSP